MDFSIQLYSGRNFPPMDALIERIAKLGYTQVEGFGGLYADADNLAKSLKANGLTMPTGHFGLSQLQDTSTSLKWAETLGMKTLFCPAIPKEDRSQDESKWVALGETLAKLGETYRKAGYGFVQLNIPVRNLGHPFGAHFGYLFPGISPEAVGY